MRRRITLGIVLLVGAISLVGCSGSADPNVLEPSGTVLSNQPAPTQGGQGTNTPSVVDGLTMLRAVAPMPAGAALLDGPNEASGQGSVGGWTALVDLGKLDPVTTYKSLMLAVQGEGWQVSEVGTNQFVAHLGDTGTPPTQPPTASPTASPTPNPVASGVNLGASQAAVGQWLEISVQGANGTNPGYIAYRYAKVNPS